MFSLYLNYGRILENLNFIVFQLVNGRTLERCSGFVYGPRGRIYVRR